MSRRPADEPRGEVRLQKFLAGAGIASRRNAEVLITEGRVLVNGMPATHLGTKVDPDDDIVVVDGRRIHPPKSFLYFVMNKPAGVITTVEDERGRKTVLDLLKPRFRKVFPVGRLDQDTTGVLLLTTDGDLAFRLLHPRHGVEKVYRATVQGRLADAAIGQLLRGVPIKGERRLATAVRARVVRSRGRTTEVEVVVHEGRKRIVKRMLATLGHPVVHLHRVRFGPITAGDLLPGKVRPLTSQEIDALKSPQVAGGREATPGTTGPAPRGSRPPRAPRR